MSFEVVPFREEFRQDVGRLLTAFWPDPSDGLAQFSWLVEENPYAGEPLVYLALSEGRAVAMRVFHGARWEVVGSGQPFDVPCGVMFVTDEAFRRRGISKLLMEGAVSDMVGRGIEHIFSFAAAPIAYRVQEQQGWRPVTHYHVVGSQEDGSPWRRSIGHQFPMLRNAYRWLRHQQVTHAPPSKTELAQIFSALDADTPSSFKGGRLEVSRTPDAAAMAALVGASQKVGLIRHVRGPDYFDWRYRAPHAQNRFLTWSQGNARGFLVLGIQTRRDMLKPVWVVDWEATDDEVLKHLLAAAVEFGQFSSLRLWQVGLSEELTCFLGQCGFADIAYGAKAPDYSPGLMVKALTDPATDGAWEIGGTSLVAPENWSMRRAYAL